ncbi:MAG: RNA polymerase sigma factor [Ignavibacteria bacterium]
MGEIQSKGSEKLVDHLFRHEAGKMVSVLTRIFGPDRMEIAEDIVQDTFLKALHEWSFNRIPENPSAWLYRVAKNGAIDILRRNKYTEEYKSELNYLLKSEWTLTSSVNNLFLDNEIKDSQLRMIFTCCYPELPAESQIALTLKTLCGFSVKEIARALITSEANINKRLFRAKQKINELNISFKIPGAKEIQNRIEIVHKVLYLLFNEGYNSSSENMVIRKDLCSEAIRLALILAEHDAGKNPATYALISLMYLHFARLDSRVDSEGKILLLKNQDRKLWDKDLIDTGLGYLEHASSEEFISEYQLEAGIAAYHATAGSFEETNWNKILELYDILVKMKPDSINRLNRAIVICRVQGAKKAIDELNLIDDLDDYYLYHSALGEMYFQSELHDESIKHFETALKLTDSKAEKTLIRTKIEIVKDRIKED